MAEKKFSELTAKGATIADTDIVAISESAGGGAYTSKSVTGANIKALVTDANMTTTDITTNDVSTSKHGFAPKAPNDTTKFLRGDATWAVVPAGGLTKFTEAEATTSPNNTVYVDSLTAAGSTTNVDVAIVPKGSGAFMLDIPDNTTTGGNKRGAGAIDLQKGRTVASNVASGAGAILIGQYGTSSGPASISIGYQNISNGTQTIAIGASNTASNNQSTCVGYSNSVTGANWGHCFGQSNTVGGTYGTAVGYSNNTGGSSSISCGAGNVTGLDYSRGNCSTLGANNRAEESNSTAIGVYAGTFGVQGRQAYSNGRFSTTGDSQKGLFVLRIATTGNTATTLTTNSSAASTNNQVILSNQSTYRFKGTIIGKKQGTTDVASWDVDGLIVRGANAAATTLNVSNVTLVQNTPAWGTPTLAADTTNGGLQVQVTGAAATNIQWTAVIETTEVIYA